MSAENDAAPAGASAEDATRSVTAGFTSWGVAMTLLRAGVVAGLWPVLMGIGGGFERENLLPYLLHLAGAVAAVVVVAMQHRIMRLIAIAFTGYSTVVLGVGAPGITGIIIWATGIAALIGVLLAALRPGAPAARWAWISGTVLAVLAGVGVSVLGLGL